MILRKSEVQYVALCIYTVTVLLADNTILMYAGTLIFGTIYGLLWIKSSHKIKITTFIVLQVAMVLFCLLCVVIGKARLPMVSINRCIIMAINIYIGACAAGILVCVEYRHRFMEFYCKLVTYFLLFVMLSSGTRIFAGRLGEYAYSPIAYGGKYNSNLIGYISVCAMLFDINNYMRDKKRSRGVRILFFLIGIVLTGSRKGIISAVLCLAIVPILYVREQRKEVLKKVLKYLIVGVTALAILVVMLFQIPSLYAIAGSRIEAMIIGFKAGSDYVDSSMDFRNQFIEYAKDFFYESPIFGIGIDNFKYLNFIEGYYAHNNYWEILTGSGVIGFSIYYLSYVVIGFRLLKAKRQKTVDALVMLFFLFLMILIDYYMVSYLQRICILMLYLAYATSMTCNVSNKKEIS